MNSFPPERADTGRNGWRDMRGQGKELIVEKEPTHSQTSRAPGSRSTQAAWHADESLRHRLERFFHQDAKGSLVPLNKRLVQRKQLLEDELQWKQMAGAIACVMGPFSAGGPHQPLGDGGGPPSSRQARTRAMGQTEAWSKSGPCPHRRSDRAAFAGDGSDPIPGLATGSARVRIHPAKRRGAGRSRQPGARAIPTTSVLGAFKHETPANVLQSR